MILSFHPCIVADENILCAGRDPDHTDLALIKRAKAVILPQGCRKTLYDMAVSHCSHVFPDYDVKFDFPNKIGQIDLFKKLHISHPETEIFPSVEAFYDKGGSAFNLDFPSVFKFDWGGEGDNVFFVDTKDALHNALKRAKRYEGSGQTGFLIQKFIPSNNRSLRVAVIGQKRISYWRAQTDPTQFIASVSKGAVIDKEADPDLQQIGIEKTDQLCEKTGINLAGVDLIFSDSTGMQEPYFLEINYFFGRSGLGGSERFYELLDQAVSDWLKDIE